MFTLAEVYNQRFYHSETDVAEDAQAWLFSISTPLHDIIDTNAYIKYTFV